MAWNQSRIKLWRRCQRAYAFRYDTNPPLELVPKVPSLPLKRGTWMHALQEAHHRTWAGIEEWEFNGEMVETWEDVQEILSEEFSKLFDEERELLGDLPGETARLFRTYLRRWEKDDQDRYSVASLSDGQPGIECVVEVSLGKWGIGDPFKGRIDLLVEDLEYGGLWVWDSKWVKRVPDDDDRMMSPQNVMYLWALRKEGYDVRGFVYNYGRTKAPTVPHPVYGGRQLSVAKKIDTTFEVYAQEMVKLHGKAGAKQLAKTLYRDKLRELKARDQLWFRRERIPVPADRIRRGLAEFLVSIKDIERRNTKHPPRTYDFRCRRDCPYHGPCVAEFHGLDIDPLIKSGFTYEEERYSDGTSSDELEEA